MKLKYEPSHMHDDEYDKAIIATLTEMTEGDAGDFWADESETVLRHCICEGATDRIIAADYNGTDEYPDSTEVEMVWLTIETRLDNANFF